MTLLSTIPASVAQASNEDITWGVDVSAQLASGQTVTVPSATLVDTSGGGVPLTLTDPAASTATTVTQRVRPILSAGHSYRLILTFTPSGTTNILDAVLGIDCPF